MTIAELILFLYPICIEILVFRFQATLTQWIARYIGIYLWLPISDLFSAVLSKIQELMLRQDIALLGDQGYIPDGSNGIYIVFLIIGIIEYFTIPTVMGWIIQSGGAGAYGGAVSKTATKAGGIAGGVAGSVAGNAGGRLLGK